MSGFFLVVTMIWSAIHGYVAWRLAWPLGPGAGRAVVLVLIGLTWLLPLIAFPVEFRTNFSPLTDAIRWAGYVAMGLGISFFFLTLLRDGFSIFLKALDLGARQVAGDSILPADPTRREALARGIGWAVVTASGVSSAVGFAWARRRPPIRHVEVPIAGLASELDGFRIAHITDLHVGPTIRRGWVQGVVDAVNALQADMIAVTGDMIDGAVGQLREHVAPLGQMRARHGVFYVTGNHEYYSHAPSWIAEFRRLGMRVLSNDHAALEHEGAKLAIGGVPDVSVRRFVPDERSSPREAFANVDPSAIRILLAHQPRSIFNAAKAGAHLQLSGHTHGGQFIPWNFLVPLQQPFVRGLHKHEDTWIYVSCGTGYWGPPFRLGISSEVACITLRRAPT